MNFFPFYRAIFENAKMRTAMVEHGGDAVCVWSYMAGRTIERIETGSYDFRCDFIPTVAAGHCCIDVDRLSAIVCKLVEVNMMQMIDGKLYIFQLAKHIKQGAVTRSKRHEFENGKEKALEIYDSLKTPDIAGVTICHDASRHVMTTVMNKERKESKERKKEDATFVAKVASKDAPMSNELKTEKPQAKRFIKPTLQEVHAYCDERNNNVNPKAFIDHYESNGWKVGKNPMKNWKAAVRTWENNAEKKPSTNGNNQNWEVL